VEATELGLIRSIEKTGKLFSFSRPAYFCQKQHTNLFTDVKYTVTSQMNYACCPLLSKNDNFIQHSGTSIRVPRLSKTQFT